MVLRSIAERVQKIDEVFVQQVKTGTIKQAMDVRTVLSEIAKTPGKTANKVMEDIIAGKTDIYDGLDRLKATGKTTDNYKHIDKFYKLISEDDVQTSIKLEATTNRDIAFKLKQIRKVVDKLIKDLS